MIPVSQDEKLPYDDQETGIRFLFKSITGDNELKYLNIISKFKKGISQEEEVKTLNELIDFFIIGWENTNKEFPADGCPSKFFKIKEKEKFFDIALKLNRIENLEQKN